MLFRRSPAAEAVRAHTSAFVGTYLAKDSSDSSSSSSARTSTDIQSLDRTRAFLRAITEVCPRLQADRVLIAKGDWITALREKLDELGV